MAGCDAFGRFLPSILRFAMAWFAKPKTKKEQIEEQRRRRRGDPVVLSATWLNLRVLLGAMAFVLMAWAVWLICFAGLSPATQQIVASQRERVRVVAAFPFKYKSEVLTQRAKKLAGELIGPIFKQPDTAAEQRMKQAVLELESALAQYQQDVAELSPVEAATHRDELAKDFTAKQGFDLDPADVVSLAAADPQKITQAFGEALAAVHSLVARGIFDPAQLGLRQTTAPGLAANVTIPGRTGSTPVLAPEEAQRQFHISLTPLDVDAQTKAAIYDLLKQALAPNIQFDQERTDAAKAAAIAREPDVIVQVREGQLLADPSAPDYDSPEQHELLQEYFAQLRANGNSSLAASQLPALRFLYTTLLLLAAVIFLKCGVGPNARTPKIFALGATLLLVNLVLVRIVVGLGSTGLFADHSDYLAVLPWLAPTMLAPILATVLMGSAPAVLMALIISMLFSMMTGDTLEIFLFNFLASLVAVYFCRDVRLRAKLVRAGLLGGAAAAVCAVYLGLVNQSSLSSADVGRQMFVAAFTGLLTAVAAIGLIPVCEHLFKITTDITLLELTDFNHPLLRKLQISAPGTYHHSLMVANLSERAAAEVGANSLMCRVCALYHDIGKVVKPEYFVENQRDGFNPHEGVSPSMSALIIKSHITEGLALAKQYKLPQVVRDVIVQHHGTTLIKFFYHKASKQQRLLTNSPFGKQRAVETKAQAGEKAVELPEPGVDESTYRYDGPKPDFRESAIVSLADSIEAASRSLRKVTAQSVEELIESIIEDRIEDHQLDDSPLTLVELKRMRESFTITLLNMLHSRISYPGQDEPDSAARTRVKDKNIVPMTPPGPPATTGEKPAANGPASSATA